MVIKSTMRYQQIPTRMTIIKRLLIVSFGEDMGKLELSYSVDGHVKWYSHF